jgi:hypothetical protein
MKIDNLLYEIESHPVLLAVGLFIVFFAAARFSSKNTSSTATFTPADNSTQPQTSDIYYQQYNSFPIATPSPITPVTTPTPSSNQLVTVTSGWLADKPGGTNNTSGGVRGKNIVNIPKGAMVTWLGTISVFNKTNYYMVTYNGMSGYVNASTIGKK